MGDEGVVGGPAGSRRWGARREQARGWRRRGSLPGARARTVAMRREGCGDDEVEKEEDGVVEEVVEDEVGVMLLVSMLGVSGGLG